MDEFIKSISNREWAALVWLTLFTITIISVKPVRSSLVDVLRTFFQTLIILPLLIALCYAAGEIYFLDRIGWWSIAHIKSTVLWLITFAFVTMFEMESIKNRNIGLGKVTSDLFTITSLFIFITELQSFPLLVEIILFPMLFYIGIISALAKMKPEHAFLSKLIDGFLVIIGLTYFSWSLWISVVKFQETATWANALEYIIPLSLSLGFLPFLFLWRIFIVYQSAFVAISHFSLDKKLVPYAKWLALIYIRHDIQLLDRWRQSIVKSPPKNKSDLKYSLMKLKHLIKREESPPPFVEPHKGWSPYLATDFMIDFGLKTGYYNQLFDDEWFAYSSMQEVGNGEILKNNIAYYIEGNEYVVNVLKLKLNINNPITAEEAEEIFSIYCIHLIRHAVNIEAAERIKIKISALEDFEERIPYSVIHLLREPWIGGIKGGYSRMLEISRKPELLLPNVR